jgi:hypothetical protein
MTDFSEKLHAAVRERLEFIERNREALLEAWVAQHDYKPDECAIVQQDMGDGTIRTWVEKRGEFEELQHYRDRKQSIDALVAVSAEALSKLESLRGHVREGLLDSLRTALDAVRGAKP